MRLSNALCGLAVLLVAGPVLAVDLYNSNGFEPTAFATGALAGQDGWTGGGGGGGIAPTVVTAPDPVLGQQAVRLEVPDLQGASSSMDHAIPAINLTGQVVTVSFDIYRQQDPWLSNLWWWWFDAGEPTYGLQWDAGVGNPGQTLPHGWNPGAGAAQTITGRYANVTMVWDFQQMKAFSWYDGAVVDNGIPITNIAALTGWTINLGHDEETGKGPEVVWIDNFVITAVPEPASLGLLALGGLLLVRRRS
ncbi:MAG: PEP-CTERM sorting domain-containing protein [Phycisphaerae bacterium]|nr:PEP-CTERM sorting domain-containing protein [Phycisphaerae bacterium]